MPGVLKVFTLAFELAAAQQGTFECNDFERAGLRSRHAPWSQREYKDVRRSRFMRLVVSRSGRGHGVLRGQDAG